MPQTQIRLTGKHYDAISRISAWSGKSYTEIVRELVLWLDGVDEDTAGLVIAAIPKARRPAFARMVLEQLADPGDTKGFANVTPPNGAGQPGSADDPRSTDQLQSPPPPAGKVGRKRRK